MSADKWTPDRLSEPAGRAIHLEQRRAQLHPIVDDLRRLAREMEAELKEVGEIEGDWPYQDRLRAWHAVRPLFKAADEVEKAIANVVSFNGRYSRSYEELPVKRARKKAEKELAKRQGQEPQAIESAPADSGTAPVPAEQESKGPFNTVFEHLRKGA
ncbi:hypothetical protein [Streptomyces sp. NPDC052496]|uniref:hypothetical protein n=1 Tax=Streptomyces sp. NPDC052496 TaxID=3154951 RepID=UPI00342C97C4